MVGSCFSIISIEIIILVNKMYVQELSHKYNVYKKKSTNENCENTLFLFEIYNVTYFYFNILISQLEELKL